MGKITVTAWISSTAAECTEMCMSFGVLGGMPTTPSMAEYLELLSPTDRPYVEAIWEAFDLLGIAPTGEQHQDAYTPVFSDNTYASCSWRGWGDLCAVWWNQRNPDKAPKTYLDYYM